MSEGKFDSHRRLCPDGACIGVIGDDGRCRVCGRDAGGGKDAAAPAGFAAAAENADDEDEDEDGDDHEDGGAVEGAEPKQAGAFDPSRRLCPDGGCIGVIGPDGVCTVCGQKAD